MAKEIWKPGNMLYPVPAVMVSCAKEKPNIITVAWAGTICSDPPMVSISVRPSRYSYDIIKDTGEFVLNLTTEKLVFAADYCGVASGRDVDKFQKMKLTPVSVPGVSVPGIEESPVNIGCRVRQVLPLGSHDLFLAEVTGVQVDQQYLNAKGKFELEKASPVVYSHGAYYNLERQLGTFGYSVRKKKRGSGRNG